MGDGAASRTACLRVEPSGTCEPAERLKGRQRRPTTYRRVGRIPPRGPNPLPGLPCAPDGAQSNHLEERMQKICKLLFLLVPGRGLEPPRSYPLAPEASVSTNS